MKQMVTLFTLCCILMTSSCAPTVPPQESEGPTEAALLTIDGYPLSAEEFDFFLQEQRALTAAQFGRDFGAVVDAGFWTRSYDGLTPTDYAKERALQAATEAKVIQIMLFELDILEDISFASIQDQMNAENADREEKLRQNEVVYGLTRYDFPTFYRYTCAQQLSELRSYYEKTYQPTQKELEEVYQQQKSFFHQGYLVEFEVAFEDTGEIEIRTLSTPELHKEDMENGALFDALLAHGSGADPMEAVVDLRPALVTVYRIEDLGLRLMEEVKGELSMLVAEEAMYTDIDARVRSASVLRDEILWNAIVME